MCVCLEERETAFACWFKRWMHWAGRLDPTDDTHAAFMDMTFIRSHEDVGYEGRFAVLLKRLRSDMVVPVDVSLDLWCCGCDFCEKWFVDSNVYRAKDIDLGIGFLQHQKNDVGCSQNSRMLKTLGIIWLSSTRGQESKATGP